MNNKKNSTRVRCDSCKRYLNISIKHKYMDFFPLKVTYFECTKCGAKYMICIDDFQTVEFKREVRQLQSEGDPENYKKIKDLKKEISKRENELKERYRAKLMEENFFNFDGQIDVN